MYSDFKAFVTKFRQNNLSRKKFVRRIICQKNNSSEKIRNTPKNTNPKK